MKRIGLALVAFCMVASVGMAQNARYIKINEVMTYNTQSIQDEFGVNLPWLEIVNTSYSTYNVRGMFITTDRSVLNKEMSVTDRIKRMCVIPSGSTITRIGAKQHLLFYLNSAPEKGINHIKTAVDSTKTVWIGLYDCNAVDLIDSVSVPVLKANTSYARISDGAVMWEVKQSKAVTPGTDNFINNTESKIDRLKREDPHGVGLTVLCMGIVFMCLALLYGFFVIFGFVAAHRAKFKKVASVPPIKPIVVTGKIMNEMRHKTSNILQDGLETKGRDKEIYIAVIAMALKQYQEDVHDVESGVLTIKPKDTIWAEHNIFSEDL